MSEFKLTTIIIENNKAIIKTTITDKVICTVPSTDLEYLKQFSEALIDAHFDHNYYIEHLSELFNDLVERSEKANEQYELWFARNYPQWTEYTKEDLESWIKEAKTYNYNIILPADKN